MSTDLDLLKRIVILAVVFTLWLGIYFTVNTFSHKRSTNRYDFAMKWDSEIPFYRHFILPYLSAYVFGPLPFLLISDRVVFYQVLLSYVILTFVSAFLHLLVPSKVERMENLEPLGLSNTLILSFQKMCKPYGNFPSMHTGYAIIAVISYYQYFGPQFGTLALAWAGLIIMATLFTKQHYILDILAGILLSLLAVMISTAAIGLITG
jgi:membrane-associated phospholipid phosphatase